MSPGCARCDACALTRVTCAQLTDLNVSCCDLLDAGGAAIGAAIGRRDCTLCSLRLRANRMGLRSARALATALSRTSHLALLDVGDNQLGDDGAAIIATGQHRMIPA